MQRDEEETEREEEEGDIKPQRIQEAFTLIIQFAGGDDGISTWPCEMAMPALNRTKCGGYLAIKVLAAVKIF